MEDSYEHVDPTEFYANLDKMVALAADASNAELVKELFGEIEDELSRTHLMGYVAMNAVHIDVTDQKMAEEYSYTSSIMVQMLDRMYTALKQVIDLPGGSLVKDSLKEETVEGLRGYEEMTPAELALYEEENELLLEYRAKQVEAGAFTVDVNGVPMGYADMNTALTMGQIDAMTYINGFIELRAKKNAYLGEVYLEMVEIRNEQAELAGYDNYGDYMYASYNRDYTQESIQEFTDAVKEYLVVPYYYLSLVSDSSAECLNVPYDSKETLAVIQEYIPEISTEMDEALNYMLRNELYDLEYSQTKSAGAYTCPLDYYGAAFIYMQPHFSAYDFSTLIHEFGHYSELYWNDMGWENSLNLDIAEVHSQGLEVLFYEFYDEIFGEDALTMQEYSITNLLGTYTQGCMVNELEMFVYAQEDVTLDQINAKMAELAVEYGLVSADSPVLAYYAMLWCNISHIFEQPFYYISFSTSVAGAFGIWEMAKEDYDAAVEAYLNFAGLGFDYEFVESLEMSGIGNVLEPESVKAVGETLMEEFELEERIAALYGGAEEEPAPEEEPVPEEPETVLKTCHVRTGDTLSKIGARFEVDWKEIAELNGIEAPYRIYAGDELLLPEDAVIKTEYVKVEAGDTLGKIAARLGLDWRILAENIGLEAPYVIYAGETIGFTY